MTLTQLKRHTVLVLSVAIAFVIVSIIFFDQKIAVFFKQPVAGDLRHFCRQITDVGLGSPYFIFSAALFIVGVAAPRIRSLQSKPALLARIERLRSWSLLSFMSLTIVGISIVLLKFIFGRQRPHISETFEAWHFDPFNLHWNWHSFPSGHTQVLFVCGTLLGILWPRQWYWFLILSSLLSLTRVATHQHFLSDVFMGAAVGYLGTLWLHHWYLTKAVGTPLRS